jgi:hypothetical protein
MSKIYRRTKDGQLYVQLIGAIPLMPPVIPLGHIVAVMNTPASEYEEYEPAGDDLLTLEHFHGVCMGMDNNSGSCQFVVHSIASGIECALATGDQQLMRRLSHDNIEARGKCAGKFGCLHAHREVTSH